MIESNHDITSKQFFTFIYSAQIGIGLLSIPSLLAREVGHDGWISLFITGILSIFIFIIIMLYLRRFKNKSILQINHILYGRYIGLVLNILVIGYLIFSAALGVRLFEEVVQLMVLSLTPPIIITIFILLPTIYISWFGLKLISRFSGIILFITFCIILIMLLNRKNLNLPFLMPMGSAGFEGILKSSYDSFFAYVGLELGIIVYPYILDKDKALKWGIIANLSSIAVFTGVSAFTTAFFGEQMLKELTFPMFNLARCYKSAIFERIDLFFIALWFPAMAISLRSYFFCGYHSICELTHNKKSTLVLFGYSLGVILLSRIPGDLINVFSYTSLLSYCTIILILFIVISFIFSYVIKERGV